MLVILENFTYETLDSEEIDLLTDMLNKEATDLNSFFLFNLEVIELSITKLNSNEKYLVQTSAVKELLEIVFLAKKIVALIDNRKDSIRITTSELESIKINANSIINGVEKVAELNKKNMVNKEPSELFIYLTI